MPSSANNIPPSAARADESLHGAWHEIHEIKHHLYGNSRAGLLERIAAVERNQVITNRLLLCVFTAVVGVLVKLFGGAQP